MIWAVFSSSCLSLQDTLKGLFNERTLPFFLKRNFCYYGMFCTFLMNNRLDYSLCCFLLKKIVSTSIVKIIGRIRSLKDGSARVLTLNIDRRWRKMTFYCINRKILPTSTDGFTRATASGQTRSMLKYLPSVEKNNCLFHKLKGISESYICVYVLHHLDQN